MLTLTSQTNHIIGNLRAQNLRRSRKHFESCPTLGGSMSQAGETENRSGHREENSSTNKCENRAANELVKQIEHEPASNHNERTQSPIDQNHQTEDSRQTKLENGDYKMKAEVDRQNQRADAGEQNSKAEDAQRSSDATSPATLAAAKHERAEDSSEVESGQKRSRNADEKDTSSASSTTADAPAQHEAAAVPVQVDPWAAYQQQWAAYTRQWEAYCKDYYQKHKTYPTAPWAAAPMGL